MANKRMTTKGVKIACNQLQVAGNIAHVKKIGAIAKIIAMMIVEVIYSKNNPHTVQIILSIVI